MKIFQYSRYDEKHHFSCRKALFQKVVNDLLFSLTLPFFADMPNNIIQANKGTKIHKESQEEEPCFLSIQLLMVSKMQVSYRLQLKTQQ